MEEKEGKTLVDVVFLQSRSLDPMHPGWAFNFKHNTLLQVNYCIMHRFILCPSKPLLPTLSAHVSYAILWAVNVSRSV